MFELKKNSIVLIFILDFRTNGYSVQIKYENGEKKFVELENGRKNKQ